MKRFLLPIVCCLIAVSLHSAFAQDPVKLSPQYYKVLIDNDEMRVLEYHLKPGEKESMHSHPRGFVYYLADAKLKVNFPDGRSEESVLKRGGKLTGAMPSPTRQRTLETPKLEQSRSSLRSRSPYRRKRRLRTKQPNLIILRYTFEISTRAQSFTALSSVWSRFQIRLRMVGTYSFV